MLGRASPRSLGVMPQLTHSFLFGRTVRLEDIARRLWNLPRLAALAATATIDTLLLWGTSDPADLALDLVRRLPEDYAIRRRVERHYRKDREFVLFHRLQLLAAERILLSGPPQQSGCAELSIEQLGELLSCLLAINDHIDPPGMPTDQTLNDLRSLAIRNLSFNSRVNVRHAIGRCYMLYFDIPVTMREHHAYVDLPASFRDATDLELDVYVATLFGLLTANYRKKIGPLDWRRLFSSTQLSKYDVQRVVAKLSLTEEQFRARLTPNFPKSFNPYAILQLTKTPLLELEDGRILVLSADLLLRRVTDGVFWNLSDFWQQHGDRFRIFFGAVIEEYAWRLFGQAIHVYPLHCAYHSIPYEGENGSQQHGSDIMLQYEDALVLFEINSGRLRLTTKETGKIARFDEDIRRYIVKGGIGQLYRVEQDYRHGLLTITDQKVDHVLPVVVTFESFPWSILTAEYIQDLAVHELGCPREWVKKVCLIDMEELEILAGMASEGKNVASILQSWQKSRMWFQPLKNYLIKEYGGGEQRPILTSVPLVDEGFWRLISAVRAICFPCGAGRPEDES